MNQADIFASFSSLSTLATTPRTGLLMLLLIAAAVIDWRVHRIPNWLTVGGMVAGVLLNTFTPTAAHGGFFWALGGLAVGLFALMPLYLIRVLGAGDVKLMATVGAFLGPLETLQALLLVMVVGGAAAIAFGVSHRALGRMLGNVRDIVYSFAFAAATATKPYKSSSLTTSVGRLPYGVSICIGTVAYLVFKQLGLLFL